MKDNAPEKKIKMSKNIKFTFERDKIPTFICIFSIKEKLLQA